LRLAEIIYLYDPGHHGPARRLPNEGRGKSGAKDQRAERHIAPVARLDAGRADALVPDLSGLLIGRLRLGGFAVMGGGAFKQAHERSLSEMETEEPPPWLSPERTAWAVIVVPWLKPEEHTSE